MKQTLWRSFAAVVIGNLIYFGLERFMPPKAQHQPFQIDWGLAVDFWLCVAAYGLLRLIR